jgi:phage anti-repressor protein
MNIDIVNLIEKNPISKLNGIYQNKLIDKVKNNFNNYEQQLFVASFYCYLKYDNINDYIIDLDDVWEWLGFSQKVKAKQLLEKNFIINKDYKLLLSQQVKQSNGIKGGHNKETFMLNVKTFKLLCMKTGTKKAYEIHEYFIKLEEILQEIFKEECEELKIHIENI